MNIEFKENLFDPDQDKAKDNQKLFSDEPKEDTLQETGERIIPTEQKEGWKVLVVDDEEDVHSVTRMALKGFTYKNKEIQFLHTYSAKETINVLTEHPDIALIFLDVVMESNNAGLELVKYIRNKLHNSLTQIVLRTGYPGQAPEREVITEYEINDYKTKTELTTFKLFTVTLASLRAYDSMMHLENLRQTLEDKVKERTAELEKKNYQIMEMDQMKTRFFSNISHEFRTPLSLIMSPIEEMLLQENIEEKDRDHLEIMYRNAVRLLGLVNQLLDLSKIDAGKLKIELSEYDICKTIQMVARSFAPLAERKKINYRVEIPEGKLITYFDRDKLEKIITNLLTNAFKFTPEKGRINITAKYNGDKKSGFLEIFVQDSGRGIPAEQLDKIFDRFYQVNDTMNEGKSGTGIGLSLTKELIVLQHGTITVESKPGKGSNFIIKLPLGKDHLKEHDYVIVKPDEIKDDSLVIKCRSSENKSVNDIEEDLDLKNIDRSVILIIEDNDDVRQHIAENFGKDYIIKEARHGKEGWEMANAFIPDLIISDVIMPEMDGIALCKKLKSDVSTSHIPLILLTAKAETGNKIEGLETGADDYITKPFNIQELKVRSLNLIEQRKKLREKYSGLVEMEPGKIIVKSADEKFLKRTVEVIEKNMGDCEFDVNNLFPEMNMSRMQLFRKLKALVNQSPGELIRSLRLKRAAQLLKQNYGNIAEIAYEVGFNNLSYFAKCFREKFGVLPSEFVK
ncbi:MAG: response regulator [Bacteroidales bacterium]|nr:response regulator [Bacteroidales bacterium]MBN2764101.1 response regulator [Bacteroidales bacterium]